MTSTTVLIRRNADRNYDKLFAKVEESAMFGRVASLSERETPGGYAVEFGYLNPEVIEWIEVYPKDFAIAREA